MLSGENLHPSQQASILSGLEGFAQWAESLRTLNEISHATPVLHSVAGGTYTLGSQMPLEVAVHLGLQQLPMADYGIRVAPSETVPVSLTSSLSFPFSFGIDLTPGLSPEDAFFIRGETRS